LRPRIKEEGKNNINRKRKREKTNKSLYPLSKRRGEVGGVWV